MRLTRLISLCLVLTYANAQAEDDLVVQNLNSASWDVTNQNGSISFTAGELPFMVLEALVDAGQVTEGDPIAG